MGMVLMRLPNGEVLMHGVAPYDPLKAHEYYIRTRQLRGRKGGRPKALTRKNPLIGDTSAPAITYTVKLADGSSAIVTAQQLAEQKAFAAKRVGEIKSKLTELAAVLKIAMRNAKEAKAKAEKEAAQPDTAAEKSAAAKDAKQYREKHSTEIATKAKTAASKKAPSSTAKKTANTDPVAELETKVTQIKDTLRAAVATQRSLAGATRNR